MLSRPRVSRVSFCVKRGNTLKSLSVSVCPWSEDTRFCNPLKSLRVSVCPVCPPIGGERRDTRAAARLPGGRSGRADRGSLEAVVEVVS
jgi:hypothetical protein